MTSAHLEVSAKRLAAYLVRQGGSPAVVASVTGVPHNFAARLARERAVRPAIRGSLAERIWSRETGVLQATLFGMCLRFVLKRYGERSEPERFVAAYRLFAVLREGVFGASHGDGSPPQRPLRGGRMATPPGACDGEDCRHHGRLPRDVNPAISSDCQASRLMGNLVTMPHGC